MASDNPIQIDVTFQATEPVNVELGEMYKGGDGTFAGLADVSLDNPTNGQVPKFNEETGKWENADDNTATELSDLTDVALDEPTNGQVLKYNEETEKFENADDNTATQLSDLTDIDVDTPTQGQFLRYNAETEKWENENGDAIPNIADLTDVNISEPSNGQVLKYNSQTEKWENADEVTPPSELSDLDDVSVSSPTDGQILKYNVQSHKFENADEVVPTEVVANPTGEATTDLTKLQVGDGIYSIPQGGGGASSADEVSFDDTNVAFEADDAQEAFENITKSLTWSEYQQLSSAEKNNGTIYLITDVNGDGQSFQPVCYSEQEREIGVWIDGKPVYEKTLKIAPVALSNGSTIAHNISNLDIIVGSFMVMHRSNGEYTLPYTSTYKNTSLFIVTSTALVFTSTDTWGASDYINLYVTLRYTKSTDTAGSGTWTPQGVPAVHYSTDEKVVGTWIDGSTIYEKTFNLQSEISINTSNWTSLGVSLSGVSVPISTEARSSRAINSSVVVDVFDSPMTAKGLDKIKSLTIRYTKSSS